jgi:CRISPR-associated protein Cas1
VTHDEPTRSAPDLVPASMLRAFAYCPRLCYLEWVSGVFEDSDDTVAGAWAHRVVDDEQGAAPAPGEGEVIEAHSLRLSSEELGLTAQIDLVEGDAGAVVPVEYKKGSGPREAGAAWPGDRLQLCAQALLLREAGYRCEHGFIYYAGARRRVQIVFDDGLIHETLTTLGAMRRVASQPEAPPPLVDSPKCPRCSLVGLCLPDEVNLLRSRSATRPRRLVPRDDAGAPLYVTEQSSTVRLREGRLAVTVGDEKLASFRDIDVSQLCVYGSVQVTTQALRHLLANEVPVCWFTHGGWFAGMASGLPSKHVALRLAQYQTGSSPRALEACRAMIHGKISNARTFLRRNARRPVEEPLDRLRSAATAALEAVDLESLLGIEGAAARTYFQAFSSTLNPPGDLQQVALFDFEGRNRRPPRDAVNCLLSFAYALLVKDLTVTCAAVGLDPFYGLYHRPRYGRPALALDLAEEFRPLVGDSVAVQVINNGEVRKSDFASRAGAVGLTQAGRRKVLLAYERRLGHLARHPLFGYRTTYRRAFEVQARLLGAWLLGEIPTYRPFTTR